MEPRTWARLRALFDEALELSSAERETFVTEATRDTPELRTALLRLLAEEERGDDILDQDALAHIPEFDAEALVGREIGGYVVEGVLGRGGMGIVYRAKQRAPRRTVALKTLSSPIHSRKDESRFRLEIEVLGALQHRAIAQVFDAGTFSVDGRPTPFVAMELVEGSTDVVRHAELGQLDLRARTGLVREACEGLHHAHRRGIIHRDINPRNLLVDPNGQVKVIDFGLARVSDSHTFGVTAIETHVGSVLGTFDYMSPEHVSGMPHEIDVRSDVFSLGCVLYELAVGRPPRKLAGVSLSHAIQQVDSADIRVPHTLPRPLRAVLARAIARSPEDRYNSAAELAQDLARFERGESVQALRGHTLALLAGFSRRHRAILLALLAVIAALGFGLYRTEAARRDAVAAEAATRAEVDTSHEIANSLGMVIASVQPFASGHEARVIDVLRDLEQSLPEIEDPRARAAIGSVLGRGLINLREFERAGPVLEAANRELAALDADHSPRRLMAVAAFADYLEQTGEYARSFEMSRVAYSVARERLGRENYTTRYLGTNTGVCAVRLGRFAEARDIYRELATDAKASRRRDHTFEAATLERLAQTLIELREPAAALVELERADEILRSNGAGDSLFAVTLKSTRAQIETTAGHFESALALHLEALAVYEARTDAVMNLVISALNAGAMLVQLGREDEAMALLEARATAFSAAEPEPGRLHGHRWIIEALAACRARDFEAAERIARQTLELGARLVPTGWPDDHFARRSLACAQRAVGAHEKALDTLRSGLPIAERLYAPGSEQVLGLAWREQALLHELGRVDEASRLASARTAALTQAGATLEDQDRWRSQLASLAEAFDEELGTSPE